MRQEGVVYAMPLTIICVAGPAATGKSSTIREFTAIHLKYDRGRGDVLGIFQMPYLDYAVGVAGGGDTPWLIKKGRKFLSRYDGLKVMIVACHSSRAHIKDVERFAKNRKATLHFVRTEKVASARERRDAIQANVESIRRLMPPRSS